MRSLIRQLLIDSIAREIPKTVKRDITVPNIPNKTHSIIGMRRSGKTYFMFQLMNQYLSKGVDRSRLIYFNFEDERLADITSKELHLIIDEYSVLYPDNMSEKIYLFFDEIQLIAGWELFTRRLMDNENVQIFISGSSAKLLSREIASSMRGRAVETIVYPYSFCELLKSQKVDYSSSPTSHANKQKRSLFENRFRMYLRTGGFPEAQGLEDIDRHLLLQGYVNTVLFRDIIERYKITNTFVLKKLIRHLISNPGSHFTVNKFYNNLKSQGLKVAKTTLYEYLAHIEDAFLIFTNKIYTESERKRMTNPIKPYVIDTGLSAAYSPTSAQNLGHLLENCVLVELCRRRTKINYLITSSKYEIDFIAEYLDGKTQAIQVCADISDTKTLERECRALREVESILPDAELVLLNLSDETEIRLKKQKPISVLPAWKWMLNG